MKKIVLIFYLSFFLLSYSENIKISTFNYTGVMFEKIDGFDGNGMLLDIIKESYSLMGVDVEFVFFPVKRAKSEFLDGSFLAFAGSSVQYRKDKSGIFPVDFGYSKFYFFYDKSKYKDINIDTIFNGEYTVGTILGSSLKNFLVKNKIPFDLSPNLKTTVTKLIKGRLKVILGGEYSVSFIIKQFYPKQLENITKIEHSPSELPLSIIFLKNNKESLRLKKIFELGLKKLKSNKAYELIKNKYQFDNIKIF